MNKTDIRFTIFSAVFLVSLIPVLILFLVLTTDTAEELKMRDRNLLSGFRDEKIRTIRDHLLDTIDMTDRISALIIPPMLESHSRSDGTVVPESLKEINEGIHSLYLFDESRKPYTDPLDDSYSARVTEKLSDQVFSRPLSLAYISFPDNKSLLCLFRKHVLQGKLLGYSAVLMDFSLLDSHMHMPGDLNLDIFDEEYKLLATTTEKQLNVVTINHLTRLMVDGYSDIMAFDRMVHSYSFINLGETSLYLTAYQSEDRHGRQSGSGSFSLFFFTVILLFSGFVTAWKVHKEVLKYGEKILVKQSFSKEMRFFSRMRSNLESLLENTKAFEKIESELKYMENDIDYIIDNIPDQENETKE